MSDHTRSKKNCKIRTSVLEGVGAGSHLPILLLSLLALLVGAILILAWVPPVSRDALIHHLAVPKLYLRNGGIYEIPSMIFSYYPMNLELLYMVPLWLGNDIVPKFIHLSFGLLTAWLIYTYIKRRIGPAYAILGVVLFLSLPIIVKLSTTVYVDLGLVFFSTASLLLFMRWIHDGFPIKLLIISAICCGLAMGTKYNGLITFLLQGLFVPLFYARYGPADKSCFLKSCAYGLIFVFVALLIFSPWMIRNYLWTQNPIYPLYDHWFNAPGASSQTVGVFAYRSLLYHEPWWEIALLPVRIFFQGQDNNPQYFDGKLTSFLLIFTIFAFVGSKKKVMPVRNEKIILMAFSVLYLFVAIFISSLRIRYIAPIIPPLLILSIYGIKNIFIAIKNFNNVVLYDLTILFIVLIVFGYFVSGINYILEQYETVKPIEYISGKVTRDEYIERYRPEYSLFKYINKNLPYDSGILFIFMGNRGYYCERDYIFDMQGSRSAFQETVKISDSAEKICLEFVKKGITHLLINEPLFSKWLIQNFPNKDQELVGSFFSDYLRDVFSNKGYHLYSIKSIAAAKDKAGKDRPLPQF